MFNRSPPLTRQRQRNLFLQQQQENRVQQNNSRPHNTANTENVHENSVVDGELLESLHHAMNSIEIENALLNVDPPNRQNVPLAGMGNNVNAENNGGLRMRFQNVGANNGREEGLVRGGNENVRQNDDHRISIRNILPRTSTPIHNPVIPELHIQHAPIPNPNAAKNTYLVQQNLPNRQNFGCNQQGLPNIANPPPQIAQQPAIPQQNYQIPATYLGFVAPNPYFTYLPQPLGYPTQQNLGYVNMNTQNPQQMQPIQFPMPYFPPNNHQFGVMGQMQAPQAYNQPIIQPVSTAATI
ncbi:hypothetical protein niasHT_031239 [Heterodera trifolii]|uniref:Uncharacterized protein n=1 Tax=Heterodera trifolii TaxID=157864 RepID=A0ABD2IG66_9BILA